MTGRSRVATTACCSFLGRACELVFPFFHTLRCVLRFWLNGEFNLRTLGRRLRASLWELALRTTRRYLGITGLYAGSVRAARE